MRTSKLAMLVFGPVLALVLAGCGAEPEQVAKPAPTTQVSPTAEDAATSSPSPGRPVDYPPSIPQDGRCGGERLAGAKAAAALPVPVLPTSPVLSAKTLVALWKCSPGLYIAEFEGGFEVVAERARRGIDSQAKWKAFVESNGYGTVTTIHGVPGLADEPKGEHRGLAQFYLDDWLIGVAGNGKTPVKDLIAAANTL